VRRLFGLVGAATTERRIADVCEPLPHSMSEIQGIVMKRPCLAVASTRFGCGYAALGHRRPDHSLRLALSTISWNASLTPLVFFLFLAVLRVVAVYEVLQIGAREDRRPARDFQAAIHNVRWVLKGGKVIR